VVSLLGPRAAENHAAAGGGRAGKTDERTDRHRQPTVYDGTPRSEIPAEERNLGLVFQSYALWPHKTVFENVAYPLKLRKGRRGDKEVQRVLDQLGWGILATAIRTSSPVASSSGWPLAGRWFTTRR
jgi:iron(III) transport system ATP-binding protein